MPLPRPARSAKVRAVLALAVLTATGAVVATRAGADDSHRFRLATVTTSSTSSVLDEVGVVEPLSRASVAFPASGTVARVEVDAGDSVAVGDTLATLDPASLERALHQAQASLAQAQLRLERALNGEDVSGGAPVATTASMSVDGDAVTVELASATVDDGELRAAQEALLAAQRQVDLDLAMADEALADAAALCSWSGDAVAEATTTTTATPPPDGSATIQACRDALDAVLAAQQKAAASQKALAHVATTLDALLVERAATPSAPTTTPQAPTGTGGEPSTSAPSASPTATSSPSSADLIAYQAAVDAAEASVTVAQQAISQATIVSPIAGKVVSIGFEVGEHVSAASADQAVVVAGTGGYEITTKVSVTELPDLETGQPVSVRPDGREATLDGEIVAIGVAATDGTTSYPVTIALVEPTNGALRDGAIASVSITTAAADDALVVPTSALTVDGETATVTVYDGSTTEDITVEVGAIGPTWTEIRRGLEAGQRVVIANLDEPLPGSATAVADSGANPFQGGPPPNGLP